MACEVNDVSFSISAGVNATGLFCCTWRWGNPMEEGLASSPGHWKSGVFLDRLNSCGCSGDTVVPTEAGAVMLKVENMDKGF